MKLRSLAKAVLPASVVRKYQARKRLEQQAQFEGLSTREAFTKIYEEGIWGRSSAGRPYFSGSGSEGAPTREYVGAVRAFLKCFPAKPDVVDLGCGDFVVGSALRRFCGRYVACDVVEPVIRFNEQHFGTLRVDFRVLDMTTDELPAGDIVFIRQVLQHLSNGHIGQVARKLSGRYRHLVLTEAVPGGDFAPNRDKPVGPAIRAVAHSGVVITAEPFNLPIKSERVLCEAPEAETVIRTTVYELE